MKTLKNKIYAIVLVGIGVAATFLLEEGIGVLIFMLMFAVPLFFAKENWIVDQSLRTLFFFSREINILLYENKIKIFI